jgi:hypothetical protein
LVAAFRHVAIDGGDHVQRLGDGESGGGTTEFLKGDFGGRGRRRRRSRMLCGEPR